MISLKRFFSKASTSSRTGRFLLIEIALLAVLLFILLFWIYLWRS